MSGMWDRLFPRIKSGRWRRILAWFLLILGCLLVPLAITGGWVRGNIMSTDGFVRTIGPLAEEPAVQEAISATITAQLFESLALEQRLQSVLPGGLGLFAGPVTSRLQDWTEQQALRLVSTQEFATIWEAAIRTGHARVVSFMNGTGVVALGDEGVIFVDLGQVAAGLLEKLREAGVPVPSQDAPGDGIGRVAIAQLSALDQVRGILRAVNAVFIILPILAVIFLAGSVAVSPKRQRAAVRVGIGLMISTAIFALILMIGRITFMNAIDSAGASLALGAALWSNLTIALRSTVWALFFVGLLLAIYPALVRLVRGESMTQLAGRGADRGWSTGRVGKWVSAHDRLLSVAVLIVGFLVLVIWDRPGVLGVVLVAVVVIVAEAAVVFLSRQSALAARARAQDNEDVSPAREGSRGTD